ncbi:hypothetical protein [Thiohalophilus thiocyanatoxydans]|uniref:hypothetical protein n=1 Tax=Thiohalophilus thiocyanatoxydans TaxID=381308 RepID=UPI001416F4D6|nr:hypothetical protein [Thiohalophilus thiocyanatoxydans]
MVTGNRKKTEIYDFDFSNPYFLAFNVNDALALANLSRVCLKIVDKEVLSTISMSDIAQYEIVDFLKNRDLNGMCISKKVRKFRGVLHSKYGDYINCTEEEFERYANIV